MAKPVIDAKQVLDDIRGGSDEKGLMQKYNLSAKGLLSLFKKLVAAGLLAQSELIDRMPKFSRNVTLVDTEEDGQKKGIRAIRAQDAANDLRSGLSDSEMMEKYMISAAGLHNLIEQVVQTGLLKQSDLDARLEHAENTVDLKAFRKRSEGKNGVESPETEINFPPSDFFGELKESKPWTCPACGKLFQHEYEECPVCGVVIAKFLSKKSTD